MRILIDGRGLGDDSAYRGIGTYLRSLLAELGKADHVDVAALVTDPAVLPDGVEPVLIARHAPGRLRTHEHQLLLPHDLRRWRADVVHSPALDPPRRSSTPWVQTLHDVFPLTDGGAAHARERRRFRRWRARYRRADAVIAISGFIAEQATTVLGIDPARVHVIHHGVSGRFRPDAERRAAAKPYLFMVGEYDPRKAHAVAFDVVARLAAQGLEVPLKVAGRVAPWYAERMAEAVQASPRPDLIEILGYVSDEDLLHLYQGATALLVTSRGEGFGLPAIEAMACGTPVVAFDNSATREVVDTAGLLVADDDVPALMYGVLSLLQQESLVHHYSDAGLRRAAAFSWQESARRHLVVYEGIGRRALDTGE